ncbi:glycoside hydrolase family 32 protein [Scandinavium sp. TWS1a]|uniref:glycoside hydrolase family 32 protein n=1 Tax=Scandinavium tedordense TaxID=2926521 RepID=UPI0021663C0E|nr:glycoside hydrolase family 32 protein [Scandinavium tedordense]MCS2172572.1 glycoside hydrolase family 32 protein [Scandinavium tedordense]
MSLSFNVKQGQRVDLWLKETKPATQPLFSIRIENEVVFKITTAPGYYHYFTWTAWQDGTACLDWLSEHSEISLCYTWHPDSLSETGVSFVATQDNALRLLSDHDIATGYLQDPLRPSLHFSPHTGWMNDPNGLHRKGEEWHLFYQYHPHSTQWGPMHWNHAVSKDLYHWRHYPVFLQPEQNLAALGATGGAFSGSAFIDAQGQTRFWYTERLPAYDLYRGYREIQKMAVPLKSYDKPASVATVLTELPPGVDCDFRDPKVWYEEADATFYMILGASVNGDPAMLLFHSADSEQWEFHHVLYVAPAYFRENGGRCVECPDFFCLDGVWVLIIGIVGYTEPVTGRHNLLFAQNGDFRDGYFTPSAQPLQMLDFGTDFYALQTWGEEEARTGFAWLYNWATQKNIDSTYCGEMSLPRRFHLNGQQQLCMTPVLPPESLAVSQSRLADNELWSSAEGSKACTIAFTPTTAFCLTLSGDSSQEIVLEYDGNSLTLREKGQDDGRYYAPISHVKDVTLSFDAGIVEVFANEGSVCGTRRYYSCNTLTQIQLAGAQAIITHYRAAYAHQ